jgi:hypothetical protein
MSVAPLAPGVPAERISRPSIAVRTTLQQPVLIAPPDKSSKPGGGPATTTLAAPSNVAAAALSATQVKLTWQASAGANGYYVYRSADGVAYTQIATVSGGTSTAYTDTTLAASSTYYYYLVAYAPKGVTATSAAVSATTPAAPPPAPAPEPTPAPVPTTDPISISLRYGKELVLAGTSGNDSIFVSQSGGTLTIVANGLTTTAAVPAAGLFIYSDYGTDVITVDGSVTLRTTVASIDGNVTTITSGGSNVSAWVDSTDAFSGTGVVHKVASFYGGVAKTIGLNITDPSDAATFRASGSLWGTGPVEGDVNQGGVGDCYFLSSLAAFAHTTPAKLMEMAVDLGDGTYVVQYMRNNSPTFVRVDADFAKGGWNGYAFAHPGANGSLWAVVMEKSYAWFRSGANTYTSLNSGWMGNVYSDLGVANTSLSLNTTASTLYNTVSSALANAKAVTFGTYSSGTTLVSSHAYTLVGVSLSSTGQALYTVRNPWGVSGDSLENGAGYATLTFEQMVANFQLGTMAV